VSAGISSHDTLSSGALLEHAVFGLDRWLRRRNGVVEDSANPVCLFRINHALAEDSLNFSDGTHVLPGHPILNLHLWNENILPMPADGATVAWARRMHRAIETSLEELACWLSRQPQLDDISALRADMRLATAQQNPQLTRIMARYGFESAVWQADDTGSLRHIGENILMYLLVLAANPVAIRSDVLWRDHALVYLTRGTLERRYGRARNR
jgi:hypothetical protein